ncbi:BnaC07g13080D [Brassica napus]|uniref:(rape) hypothetical protein n=1 Tax=Brassica napus TaxID=3708 RepID=A0A078GPJ6_BRANA|nr:unnamed protein product [Brassica napus]CDY28480.1 BnaC07g13080D [Brassica napus]
MKQSRQIKTRANEPKEEKVGEITAAGGDLKQDPNFFSLSLRWKRPQTRSVMLTPFFCNL